MTRKNPELIDFEKESKRISKMYHIPAYHSDCFMVNHVIQILFVIYV